ncbi:MAG: SOS response-associated peptidase family protein [Leucobacter sp.]
MCASYGLGGFGRVIPLPGDLEPLSEPASLRLLDEWMEQSSGSAKITGRIARNLNPIIRAGEDGRELVMAWWWLWPDARGPAKFTAFNARDDKLITSWRQAFATRALLPATWYVEKKGRFHLPDHEMFGIAAVTNTVVLEDGSRLLSYSMVTRDAPEGSEADEYWYRMPLILPRHLHDEWLDQGRPGDRSLVERAQAESEEISRAVTTSGKKAPPPAFQ